MMEEKSSRLNLTIFFSFLIFSFLRPSLQWLFHCQFNLFIYLYMCVYIVFPLIFILNPSLSLSPLPPSPVSKEKVASAHHYSPCNRDGKKNRAWDHAPTIFLGTGKEGCSKLWKSKRKERLIRFSLGNAAMHDHDQTPMPSLTYTFFILSSFNIFILKP